MAKVYFGSAYVRELKTESTLPGKLDRILELLDIAPQLKDKRTCIKMHLGANVGYSTIHPLFVRRLVSFIKAAGGHPFVADTHRGVAMSVDRGYTEEVVGCPILPIAGCDDDCYHSHQMPYKNLTELRIGREIWDSDYIISLSHAKGHGNSGYGGAIKNLAVGAMVTQSRHAMHMIQHADDYWDAEACTHYSDGCNLCVETCKLKAMRFADDRTLHIGYHECNFCLECNETCPVNALTVRHEIAHSFQELLALAARVVLRSFGKGDYVFINFAIDITPFCDCMGLTTPSLVPDVGIFASRDIVAVEKATLDGIDYRNLLPDTLPGSVVMNDREGHLFQRIHGKDPYIQVYACERLGLGSTEYESEEVG